MIMYFFQQMFYFILIEIYKNIYIYLNQIVRI